MEELNSLLQAGKLVLVVNDTAFPSRTGTCEEIINTVYLPAEDFKHLQKKDDSTLLLLSPSGRVLFTTKELDLMVAELARLSQVVTSAMQRPKTKLAVSFQDGQAAKVLEFDPNTTKFEDVLEAFQCDQLVMKFPKRAFSRAEHGTKTLAQLDLVGAVSLLGSNNQHAIQPQQQQWIVFVWLVALWNWIFRTFAAPPQPAVVVEPSSAPKRKENNEYWNGDSTVFEAPPDE